jgi:hypothetical protein
VFGLKLSKNIEPCLFPIWFLTSDFLDVVTYRSLLRLCFNTGLRLTSLAYPFGYSQTVMRILLFGFEFRCPVLSGITQNLLGNMYVGPSLDLRKVIAQTGVFARGVCC